MGSGDLNSLLQACVGTDSPTETSHPSNPKVLHFSVYRSALEALELHSQTVSRLPEAELIGWEFQIKFPVQFGLRVLIHRWSNNTVLLGPLSRWEDWLQDSAARMRAL